MNAPRMPSAQFAKRRQLWSITPPGQPRRLSATTYLNTLAAEVHATWADIGKAERLLSWRPQLTFRDGVAAMVRWYQTNREWAKDVSIS